MKSAADYYVFQKWAEAPSYAFGGRGGESLVPVEDKEAYWHVYGELLSAAESQISGEQGERLFLRPKRYSRVRGSRGHRPTDLWVSICAKGAELLGFMPQVYAIASDRGLEIGFAVSIAEDDYFDVETKQRNRSIIPFINSKLPRSTDEVTLDTDLMLRASGAWHFNGKTRLLPGDAGFDRFASLGEMLDSLRSGGAITGGGAITRIFGLSDLEEVDLEREFAEATRLFAPLLSRCAPTPWDVEVRSAQEEIEDLLESDEPVPTSDEDGRRKVLAEVARRQGQARFRNKLLEAYDSTCAISGTDVPDTLQAAHIRPYNGPATNHVGNGLLLRADLHTLFDLKLITIDPRSLRVVASPRLKGTDYWQFHGRDLRLPKKRSEHPAASALEWHFRLVFDNRTNPAFQLDSVEGL
ncbi:hypothetical protein ELH22_21455 [Rhizobium ruizarguesonis]|uniref:HNH endonuclease n=1 Tax=Rhizobium ruizarguesonis TaxID=2081791 RepID=UPI00102FDE21|nr:HNH endonuclease [Rhizobium ruizarguesonis]TBD65709.1 hypothetical protein ELH22_21455 [Rhizobium ruizarguesonis]